MPVVTALRERPRGRVEIELDGAPWRLVPTDAVVRSGLFVGRALDRETARSLGRELRRAEALTRALRALTARDRSRRALDERLGAQAWPPVPAGRRSRRSRGRASSTTTGWRRRGRRRWRSGGTATPRSASTSSARAWPPSRWRGRWRGSSRSASGPGGSPTVGAGMPGRPGGWRAKGFETAAVEDAWADLRRRPDRR